MTPEVPGLLGEPAEKVIPGISKESRRAM